MPMARVRRLLYIVVLFRASLAAADAPILQIAATNGSAPSLRIRGPASLFSGESVMQLLPGDDRFKGAWLNDAPAFQTLEHDRPREGRRRLDPRHLVALRRIHASPGLQFLRPSTMTPILRADGDLFLFHHDPQGDFGINLLTAVRQRGTFQATLQVIDLSGIYRPSRPFTLRFATSDIASPDHGGPPRYACPMRCDGDKTFDQPGDCPHCRMKLSDTKSHMDHRPRHGGQFYMASNQIHHLEGVFGPNGEFRLYFYDEFTQPLPADLFFVRAFVVPTGAAGTPAVTTQAATTQAESTSPRPVTFRCSESRRSLRAKIDATVPRPARMTVWIDFRDGGREQPFEFQIE